MNLVYSMLLRGEDAGAGHYWRKIDPAAVPAGRYPSIGEALVSPAWSADYQAYAAEQLVQLCRRSLLAGRLAEIDPLSTYDCEFEPPVHQTATNGLPAGIRLDLVEPDVRHDWIEQNWAVALDPAGVASVNGVPCAYSIQDGLTSAIPLASGLACRFRGTLPAPLFIAVVSAVRVPYRNLADLVVQLRASAIPWLPAYADHQSDRAINDWLASFVLNYVESELP